MFRSPRMSHHLRWRGARGELYVIAQIALIVLVFLGPRTWPVWTSPYVQIGSVAGSVLLLTGSLLLLAGIFKSGTNLTAAPYPKEQGTLVETGPYQFVRHPMYCGVITLALGWALLVHGWLTFGYVVLLFVFFDFKSRREEQWLKEKYPGYTAYQQRVHKLIPFLY